MYICEKCKKEHDGKHGSGRFCSRDCSISMIHTKESLEASANTKRIEYIDKVKHYNEQPNLCLNCDSPILCNNEEKLSDIKRRKFCNNSCAATFNNTKRVYACRKVKSCLNCNKSFVRKYNKFCCSDCFQEYRVSKRLEEYKNGSWDGSTESGAISVTIEKYIRSFYDNKCQLCGWDKIHNTTKKVPLEIHHKDGCSNNNNFENLQLLCPNCHSLTDTFRNLNPNSDRKYRNKK